MPVGQRLRIKPGSRLQLSVDIKKPRTAKKWMLCRVARLRLTGKQSGLFDEDIGRLAYAVKLGFEVEIKILLYAAPQF